MPQLATKTHQLSINILDKSPQRSYSRAVLPWTILLYGIVVFSLKQRRRFNRVWISREQGVSQRDNGKMNSGWTTKPQTIWMGGGCTSYKHPHREWLFDDSVLSQATDTEQREYWTTREQPLPKCLSSHVSPIKSSSPHATPSSIKQRNHHCTATAKKPQNYFPTQPERRNIKFHQPWWIWSISQFSS